MRLLSLTTPLCTCHSPLHWDHAPNRSNHFHPLSPLTVRRGVRGLHWAERDQRSLGQHVRQSYATHVRQHSVPGDLIPALRRWLLHLLFISAFIPVYPASAATFGFLLFVHFFIVCYTELYNPVKSLIVLHHLVIISLTLCSTCT